MSYTPKILALAGSARKDSINVKLVKEAMQGAQEAGAEVTFIDFKRYALPLYDGDVEAKEGLPKQVVELKKMMHAADGFLMASPEYNGSLTPMLKNFIDWTTRPIEGEAPLACYMGKVAGILGTSPGGLGGLRGLTHLRTILSGIQTLVVPNQQAVPHGFEAFDDQGSLKDLKTREKVRSVGRDVAQLAAKLHAGETSQKKAS